MPLFAGLTEEERLCMAEVLVPVEFSPGDTIIVRTNTSTHRRSTSQGV